MQLNSFQGDKNPRGRPKGRGISWYLARIGDEEIEPGKTKKEMLAIKLFEIALDEKTPIKERIALASEMMDRLEGKPVAMNINADMAINPFDGIPTERLEALRAKLLELKSK